MQPGKRDFNIRKRNFKVGNAAKDMGTVLPSCPARRQNRPHVFSRVPLRETAPMGYTYIREAG